jgi:hypothetical protein
VNHGKEVSRILHSTQGQTLLAGRAKNPHWGTTLGPAGFLLRLPGRRSPSPSPPGRARKPLPLLMCRTRCRATAGEQVLLPAHAVGPEWRCGSRGQACDHATYPRAPRRMSEGLRVSGSPKRRKNGCLNPWSRRTDGYEPLRHPYPHSNHHEHPERAPRIEHSYTVAGSFGR